MKKRNDPIGSLFAKLKTVTNVPTMVNKALNQVSRKLRQIFCNPSLTGPNVQKEKAGVKRSAGCVMIVLVALLIPRAKQRVPNACVCSNLLIIHHDGICDRIKPYIKHVIEKGHVYLVYNGGPELNSLNKFACRL